MIHLHYWPTSNGNKISIYLEEAGIPYEAHAVKIASGEQNTPEFRKISPNAKIPAIVDTDPAGGGHPISVFESGAILLYLVEKTGQFMPKDIRRRKSAYEWLFWQVSGIGPVNGQRNHFRGKPEQTYSRERFDKEAERLNGVVDAHLAGRDYLAEEFSVADIALYPAYYSAQQNNGETFSQFPNLSRWIATMEARPGVQRAIEKGKKIRAG